MTESKSAADKGLPGELPLGKTVNYASAYDAGLLCGISRKLGRDTLEISDPLPFVGEDVWTAYELSWLDDRGKPQVAMGRFHVPCDSEHLIESKSLKLYLNSLNQTRFANREKVSSTLGKDLSAVAGIPVQVVLSHTESATGLVPTEEYHCIDSRDLDIEDYQVNPDTLKSDAKRVVSQRLVSHLLRSLCPVTGQPDWGSLLIEYEGPQIDPNGLLAYVVSFREHAEFHEQCVERVFTDLMNRCEPTRLSVYARYLRRGGLDINPYRSTHNHNAPDIRLNRQ